MTTVCFELQLSRAFMRSTVECEEINDFGVKGRDMSQIHINNQTNTLRMHKCGGSKTHKVLLCFHNWIAYTLEETTDQRRSFTHLKNQSFHRCFYRFVSLFQTWPSVCFVSLLTCLMLLMGSLINCAEGVQLKRGIDKQSPWQSAWVNWISTNPPHTGMLSIFSQ